MGYKRDDGTFDDKCLEKAKPGEPIFVFRAQDLSAPEIVREWVAYHGERLDWDHPKIVEASKCAIAMEEWANEHGGKLPD